VVAGDDRRSAVVADRRQRRIRVLPFGKGRHAAGLNFGDVFAYALARTSGEPLLFQGDDFAKTDIGRVT